VQKPARATQKKRAAKKETNQKRRRREEWLRELEKKEKMGKARSLRNSKMLKHLIYSAFRANVETKDVGKKKKTGSFLYACERSEYKPFSFTKYVRLSSCNV
jgi:hypothetical protein